MSKSQESKQSAGKKTKNAAAAPKKAAAAPKASSAVKSKEKAAPAKTASSKKVAKTDKEEKKVAPAKKAVAKKAASASASTKKAASTKKGGASATKEAKSEAKSDNAAEKSTTRYFKAIVEGGEAHGRFSGAKPKQAANKALTSILKSKEQTGGNVNGEIKFTIVECTRGSKHKQYHYIGKREKLDKPMKVKIGSGANAKEIEYKFNNRVMKDKSVVVKA